MTEKMKPVNPYASPACLAHELDPLFREHAATDASTWRDVNRWRRAERERLRSLRKAVPQAQRRRDEARIEEQLSNLIESGDVSLIGAYWPIQGEPDLRRWMREQVQAGLIIALPVVSAPQQPLQYHRWQPGAPMRRGVWGIAEPNPVAPLAPQLVIAPLVGVDRQNYRLGNGGGYFDRTLAAATPRPLAVGVGFACACIDTIYPQAHDIPMDEIITGAE